MHPYDREPRTGDDAIRSTFNLNHAVPSVSHECRYLAVVSNRPHIYRDAFPFCPPILSYFEVVRKTLRASNRDPRCVANPPAALRFSR